MAQEKSARRAEIDLARGETDYADKRGMELARDFIKKDSSYYVGHLFEGAYKFNRASDKKGFFLAIQPLKRALRQIEKDYKGKLALRTSDYFRYIDIYKFHRDYSMIVYMLDQCYENTDNAEAAIKLCHSMTKYNMQLEIYCNPYTTLAWIYHRNRIYTDEKYPSLKNTIADNEKTAMKFLDSSSMKFYRDLPLNATFFAVPQLEQILMNTYHYKSILHDYNYRLDSAEYYFDYLLKQPPAYAPYNNYAHLKMTGAELNLAYDFFEKSTNQRHEAKQTREQYYMLATLDVYRAEADKSIEQLRNIIKAQGSSPGFGWHNIALGRCYLYQGQLDECFKATKKADEFEEMYIGTTWLPEQYKSASAVVQYMAKSAEINQLKFQNKGWWYTPKDFFRVLGLYLEKFFMKFNLATVFSQSHEREQVTYHIFSSENLITFDEVWFLLKDFNPEFFRTKFQELGKKDKRPMVKKYFQFMEANFLLEDEQYADSKKLFNEILQDKTISPEFEKLFQARIHLALASIAEEEENITDQNAHLYKVYELYPQLLPLENISPAFSLKVNDQEFAEALKKTQMNFTELPDANTLNLDVQITKAKQTTTIHYRVLNGQDKVLREDNIEIAANEIAAKKLSNEIFAIKAIPGTDNEKPAVKTKKKKNMNS